MRNTAAIAHPGITERWTLILLGTISAYLVLFALRFADERLFMDSGYYLARVINEGKLRIEHGRWVLAFAELLPLAGVKLGLSMKALIMLHSLNNVIWMVGCVAVAWRILGDRQAALTIALLHLLGLAHGLFCPVFELYYGADLIVLFIALLRADQVPPGFRMPVLVAVGALAASCHAIGFLLICAMLLLEQRRVPRKEAVLLAVMLALVAIVRVITASSYEKDSAAFLLKAMEMPVLARVFGWEDLVGLLRYSLLHYPDVLVLALITILALMRARRRGAALFFALYLLMMHILISLKLPGYLHDRYREQVNVGAAAWVTMALMMHAPLSDRLRRALPILLLAAITYRIAIADSLASYYAERKEHIERGIVLARESGLSKGIIAAPVYFGPEHDVIELGWSVPVESLLLSAKPGPESTVSLITTEDIREGGLTGHLRAFWFRRWDTMPESWLDERWFMPPSGEYVPLRGEPPDNPLWLGPGFPLNQRCNPLTLLTNRISAYIRPAQRPRRSLARPPRHRQLQTKTRQ